MRICKEFTFDSAHRLLNYDGLCKNLHGHTYKLQVELEAEIGEDGFIVDFSILKKEIEKVIVYYDHRVLLDKYDDKLNNFCNENNLLYKVISSKGGPTVENIGKELWKDLTSNLSTDIFKTNLYCIRLWETPTSYVEIRRCDTW